MDEADIFKAGKIANEIRQYGLTLITVGGSYNAVITAINERITQLDAIAAFPPQIAINEVAAHYIPSPGDDVVFSEDMVVSLDVGVCVNGAIGDCAASIDLTPDKRYTALCLASQSALEAVQKSLRVGMTLGEMGEIIAQTIAEHGYEPVRNLSGHGLGEYEIHTKPTIPNYNNASPQKVVPGMHFAIEPFATTGKGFIKESGEAHIFSFNQKKPIRSPFAKAVLKKILSRPQLPFATHDLIDAELTLGKVKLGLRELLQQQVIIGHPPLVEETKGIVTQAENTIYVDLTGTVHITTK